MIETIELKDGREVRLWAPREEIEASAIQQLINVAKHPSITGAVCAMPDVHTGMGATIGSVIPSTKGIIPAAVGVDIGCGMIAQRLRLTNTSLADLDLSAIRQAIERVVPVGVGKAHTDTRFTRSSTNWVKANFFALHGPHRALKTSERAELRDKAWAQMGTLGSGNHFIEICKETSNSPGYDGFGTVWLVIHSGSRGIGHWIAQHWIKTAKELPEGTAGIEDKNLAWIPQEHNLFYMYLADTHWAQAYAIKNRLAMVKLVLDILREEFGIGTRATSIHCHHNYVCTEYWGGEPTFIVRKGAIRAHTNDYCIIPGSMGSRTYLARGLNHSPSFNSAPHGAGRTMSRSQAKREFSVSDLNSQTEGVECRKDHGVLDEIPSAYKDIDTVMERSTELVRPSRIIKQVLCVKG